MSCAPAHPLSETHGAPRETPAAALPYRVWLQACRMAARVRERRALAALDDRQLADIGLTREQASFETRKPFWRE